MFSLRTCLLLIACSFFHPLVCREEPLSVVIIGGGPAGLATAIEAKSAGANVIIVEKRDRYLRDQFVFLLEPALNLLNKWEVSVPEIWVGHDSEERIGITKIRNLEIGLAQRVNELGIPKILGEFQEFSDGKVVLSQNDHKIELTYDLLVGADGTHSTVRDELKIASNLYGCTLGAIAIIPSENANLEFILPVRSDSFFINKIIIPSATIISAQGKELSKEKLASAAMQSGWIEEALFISSDKVRYIDEIEVVLQQSTEFSDQKKSIILLGDAAASASFLQGMGANCALETAFIAGLFFKTELKESDYKAFNGSMKEATDRLIVDSAFLFK